MAIASLPKPAVVLPQRQPSTKNNGEEKVDWPIVPIGQVVEINPRPEIETLDDDTLVSFVPMKCVEEESGRFQPLEDRKVKDVRKGYTPFKNGDVLFAKVTPCMENGKAAIVKGLTNGIGFGSTELFALRPASNLLQEFLFYFLIQESFRRSAAANMTGAVGLRRVPKAYLAEQPIHLPPKPEQRRIVAEIERQFTRLDAGVAALRRTQANLKRYRAAVLKAACEGRLLPAAGRHVPAFGGYGPPNTLPRGWRWTTPAEVCEQVVDCHNKTAPYTESGIPLVRTTNIRGGKIDMAETKFVDQPTYEFWSRRCPPKPGDVLFTREAPMGEAGIVPDSVTLCMGQRMMLMRASPALLNRYLLIALLAPGLIPHITRTSVGSGVKHLRVRDVESLPISLPPFAEQKRIVAEVERRLSVVEELETVVTANLQRATRLRQSILQMAFSGELFR